MFLQTIVAHGDALGIERICLNDVGTGLKVLAMDVTHNEWTCQRQDVVAAFQFLGMACKLGSTEVFFTQLVLLNHRTHGTVQYKQSVCGEFFGLSGHISFASPTCLYLLDNFCYLAVCLIRYVGRV